MRTRPSIAREVIGPAWLVRRSWVPPSRTGAPMSNEAVNPLRRRMIDDMTIRHFGAKTQADYIRTIRTFAAFLGQSPDQAEPEDLRRFQLQMAAQGASPAKMNAAVSALRFFFKLDLDTYGVGQGCSTLCSRGAARAAP